MGMPTRRALPPPAAERFPPPGEKGVAMKRPTLLRLTPALMCLVLLFTVGGKKPPDDAGTQQAFGVEMAKRGLWSEALFRFKQVERLEPGNPRNLNNIAVSYEALGNFEKALEYYQRAIKADPANKDLKSNYSRFVEFYRSFKPKEPEAGAAGES